MFALYHERLVSLLSSLLRFGICVRFPFSQAFWIVV